MELDLDTFLTTVYCLVDDWYREQIAPQKPVRRGHRPELTDSEVLTLILLAQWQGDRKERAFLRYARRHWQRFFPRQLSQSAFNRRARDLALVLCQLGPAIAQLLTEQPELAPAYEVLDGTSVPLMRRCRGKRHRLFANEAAMGRGGSDRDWYYGVKLMAVVEPNGMITGFVYGPANTEERWLAEALLRWRQDPTLAAPTAAELAPVLGPTHRKGGKRQGPTGPVVGRLGAGAASDGPYLGDLGFEGKEWQRHWRADYGATVLTQADYLPEPTPADQAEAKRWFSGKRQQVETELGWLDSRFGLKYPRARTPWGLLTRVAAKVAAFDVAVYVNHCFGRETFQFVDLFSC